MTHAETKHAELYAAVRTAEHALLSAGLYAKASHPLDWENARNFNKNPHVIRGGTHREKTPDLNIVHGSFTIELTPDDAFRVTGEAVGPETFKTLPEAVTHITRFWKPINPLSTPTRRG